MKILPQQLCSRLITMDKSLLCEIRIRANAPVTVNYGGEYYFINAKGLSKNADNLSLTLTGGDISNIILKASNNSIYTVNDNICEGYVTIRGGVRIGICGEAVMREGSIRTVKNFTSLIIRIPHEVKGCATDVIKKTDGIKNTLVLSPPAGGKTTFLRDYCRQISDRGINVLLCDERYELGACFDGRATLDVGICTDIMSGFTKNYVLSRGIRAFAPQVIILDELVSADIEGLVQCLTCGVKIIASAHAADIEDVKKSVLLSPIYKSGLFDRFIVLVPKGKSYGSAHIYEGLSYDG